jgi:hypothetical protein
MQTKSSTSKQTETMNMKKSFVLVLNSDKQQAIIQLEPNPNGYLNKSNLHVIAMCRTVRVCIDPQ